MALVWLLGALQVVAFGDRFLLTLVATPLKQALALSDTQLGLLQGSAFALPYALALPFAGRLADARPRVPLLLASLALWSAASLACGLLGTFPGIVGARLALGLGQAALMPAALALLAARLGRHRLGRGVSVLTAGATLGRSLALLGGGAVLAWLVARGGLWGLAPWRGLFVLAVVPNLVLATLLRPVAEPPVRQRRELEGQPALAWLLRRRGAYGLHALAATAAVLLIQAFTAWAPTFYVRAFGLTAAGSGMLVGTVILLAAPAGHLSGGALLDRMRRDGRRDAAPLVLAASLVLALPGAAVMSLAPSLPLSLVGCTALVAVLGLSSPAGLGGIQFLTPRALRGRVSALFLAAVTLAGLGLGPLLVGLLNDRVFGEGGVGLTLLVLVAAVGLSGAAAALAARRASRARSKRPAGAGLPRVDDGLGSEAGGARAPAPEPVSGRGR